MHSKSFPHSLHKYSSQSEYIFLSENYLSEGILLSKQDFSQSRINEVKNPVESPLGGQASLHCS